MITFEYPYNTTPTASITLKNPDYGNSEQHDVNTMFHIGMDGTVYSYKKALRQIMLLNFSSLTAAQMDAFETFYLSTAGKDLKYTDVDGAHWEAIITNNPLEMTTSAGRGSCELKNTTIQLSARLLPETTNNALIDNVGNVLTDGTNVLVFA